MERTSQNFSLPQQQFSYQSQYWIACLGTTREPKPEVFRLSQKTTRSKLPALMRHITCLFFGFFVIWASNSRITYEDVDIKSRPSDIASLTSLPDRRLVHDWHGDLTRFSSQGSPVTKHESLRSSSNCSLKEGDLMGWRKFQLFPRLPKWLYDFDASHDYKELVGSIKWLCHSTSANQWPSTLKSLMLFPATHTYNT